MALKTSAQSSAERHIGPTVSCVHARAIAPYRLTRPNVGRMPVSPFRADGEMTDPPVSGPTENATSPAAVAEPGPAEEPEASCWVFQGFRVTPPNHWAVSASAPDESFATRMAPASLSLVYTVASVSMTWSLKGEAPHV